MSVSAVDAPPALPTPTQILAALPRLLSLDLAGREDRAIVRLARRMGYDAAASLTVVPGKRLSSVELRAATGELATRLEIEVLGSSEVSE